MLYERRRVMARQVPMRLGEEYELKIQQIADVRGGLKKVQVVRLGIDALHRQIFGRRSPDMVPVRKRGEPRRAKGSGDTGA
jgi:hypothetical protein